MNHIVISNQLKYSKFIKNNIQFYLLNKYYLKQLSIMIIIYYNLFQKGLSYFIKCSKTYNSKTNKYMQINHLNICRTETNLRYCS